MNNESLKCIQVWAKGAVRNWSDEGKIKLYTVILLAELARRMPDPTEDKPDYGPE